MAALNHPNMTNAICITVCTWGSKVTSPRLCYICFTFVLPPSISSMSPPSPSSFSPSSSPSSGGIISSPSPSFVTCSSKWWLGGRTISHLLRFSASKAVNSNGKEDVEENVVAKDEQDQEVEAHGQAETRWALCGYILSQSPTQKDESYQRQGWAGMAFWIPGTKVGIENCILVLWDRNWALQFHLVSNDAIIKDCVPVLPGENLYISE